MDLGLPDNAGQTLLSGSSLHPVSKESDKNLQNTLALKIWRQSRVLPKGYMEPIGSSHMIKIDDYGVMSFTPVISLNLSNCFLDNSRF